VVFAVRRPDTRLVDGPQRDAYMHAYGVTQRRLRTCSRAAARLRCDESDAHFYRRPITLDDHQAREWIAEPAIRLFDCCQETCRRCSRHCRHTRQIARGCRALAWSRRRRRGAVRSREEVASNHHRPDSR
jgi:hypothetical protein